MSAASVSIVMCVRDGERYLAAAIDSLLAQSQPPSEIIVVDDGSIDTTPSILRSYGRRITVITQSATGIFPAMNRGVRRATGELVGFLDADDFAPSAAIEVRLGALAIDPAADGVIGRTVQFVSPDLDAATASKYRVDTTPLMVPSFPAALFRRALLDRVGPLDESRRTGSTIDWISRARSVGVRLCEVDAVVVERRVHGGNIGALEPEVTRQNLLDVVRAHRRRSAGGPR